MHLTITSLVAGDPTAAAKCVRSVLEQSHQDWHQVFLAVDQECYDAANDAAGDDRRVFVERVSRHGIVANLVPVWLKLQPQEPIVWLDGDDWLAVPDALAVVSEAHAAGAWVSWGSFVCLDGRRGLCTNATQWTEPRIAPWWFSHLKTFRAGLVHRMRPTEWIDAQGENRIHCIDLRVMFAALEMTPRARRRYVDNVLVVYNDAHSFHATADAAGRQLVAELEAEVRSEERYAPIRFL